LHWAWADVEQENGDYRVINALHDGDERGWAVDAHNQPGGRVALFLAERSFGYRGGTEVRVTLKYRSRYPRHTFGRVRLAFGAIAPHAVAALPEAHSGWYAVGPFPADSGAQAFAQPFGPEGARTLDLAGSFGFGNLQWRHDEKLRDGRLNEVGDGVHATYVAQRVFAPSARRRALSLGSDDGFRLWLDGTEVASRQVERSLKADQDQAAVDYGAGEHLLVLKVANAGGDAGFFCRRLPRAREIDGDMVLALLPSRALTSPRQARLRTAWRIKFSPLYRERLAQVTALQEKLAALDAKTPRTMVMRERPEARATFVLSRGAYDRPDRTRPVERGVPPALGRLPDDAPRNRLGLAQWLVSPDNPLVARVAVNRVWELVFGTGLVRTSEDFGMQGEWPSHPELLDWLAVELRESGWDVQRVLLLLVKSATFRQASRGRPETQARDPDNSWLARFPRRRLPAEAIRDQALYVSHLLVERLGGPSVKPYQPEGLWQEVAMPASNTRLYKRDDGEGLWRRSLYTYWKRACPPPSLMAFDAPTREFCTLRRVTTNTPLQALVLWNDEQFVEAARGLAQRVLGAPGDDACRAAALLQHCTGHRPDAAQVDRVVRALAEYRARYAGAEGDARALIDVGVSPAARELLPTELAAWTMVANACLNLDATLCLD
jgi:hypothetical protein